MSIVTFPDTPGVARVEWTPPARTQLNRSMWSGAVRSTILPTAGFWKAKVTIVTVMGEAQFRVWRKFLMDCQGQANSFRMVAVEGAQNEQTTVKVNGAGQTGLSLVTDGWGFSGTAMKAGQMITLGDQLIGIAADAAIVAGAATLSLSRRIRTSPADNDPVEVRLPTAMMSMVTDDLLYSVEPGQLYGLSFDCQETWS